jgi:hypothetical protein
MAWPFSSAPGLFRLLPGCRRTGGSPVYEPCHTDNVKFKTFLSQPVSRNTRLEVHRRMTSCMGVPQVGHEARKG